MLAVKRTISVPQWLEENEVLALLLSYATTKYEYFATRARAFAAKYGCDYMTFKKRIEESGDESFNEWDDLMAWEALDTAAQEWKARHEELQTCLIS